MLRKTKRYSVLEPLATVPKLWLVVENIFVAHSWATAASAEATARRHAPATVGAARKIPGTVANMGRAPRRSETAMRKRANMEKRRDGIGGPSIFEGREGAGYGSAVLKVSTSKSVRSQPSASSGQKNGRRRATGPIQPVGFPTSEVSVC